jgi:short-subunit dehydrogenase
MGTGVVVITGASLGVGRATAIAFARAGYDVALVARAAESLDAATAQVEASGSGRALACPADVSVAAEVDAAAKRAEDELGPIDVWVNCAMASVFSPVAQYVPEEVRRTTEVTYLGFVHGMLAALRHMRPRDRGVIINVGSALCYRAIPLQAAYCGAKHAMLGFTNSLRCELLHDRSKIRVTLVHLPAMNTPQFDQVRSRLAHKPQPVPPIFQPEVAARAILRAARHPRREYWIGAPTVGAIVGQRLVPGLLDRYLARTAFKSQQTPEPDDPDRPDNLEQPLPGDLGVHGGFGDHAHAHSLQSWFSTHRRSLLSSAAAVAAAGLLAHSRGAR